MFYIGQVVYNTELEEPVLVLGVDEEATKVVTLSSEGAVVEVENDILTHIFFNKKKENRIFTGRWAKSTFFGNMKNSDVVRNAEAIRDDLLAVKKSFGKKYRKQRI